MRLTTARFMALLLLALHGAGGLHAVHGLAHEHASPAATKAHSTGSEHQAGIAARCHHHGCGGGDHSEPATPGHGTDHDRAPHDCGICAFLALSACAMPTAVPMVAPVRSGSVEIVAAARMPSLHVGAQRARGPPAAA